VTLIGLAGDSENKNIKVAEWDVLTIAHLPLLSSTLIVTSCVFSTENQERWGATNPATSTDFQKVVDAYTNGNFATALRQFNSLADQGNSRGQKTLGLMHAKGKGEPLKTTLLPICGGVSSPLRGTSSQERTDNVGENMSSAKIETVKRLANEWIEKHNK
jgi:hypothetical protein